MIAKKTKIIILIIKLDISHQVSLVSLMNIPAVTGNRHVLRCSANRSLALPSSTQLEVNWLDPQNNSIEIRNILFAINGVTMTNNTILSSELIFNHVRTSLAGPYTCVVHMKVPGMSNNYTVSRTLNFTVKSKDVLGVVAS